MIEASKFLRQSRKRMGEIKYDIFQFQMSYSPKLVG